MKELVFLLEERSAEALLESLLPRLLHEEITPRLIPFEGKQDLENQLVRKLRGYLNPKARFIVLRDQDSAPDCQTVKAGLMGLCRKAGKEAATLVRVACCELETFYLADLKAVGKALGLPQIAREQDRARFRRPDLRPRPSEDLAKLTKHQYQKVGGSRHIGLHLDLENRRSASFRNLVAGIRKMEAELLNL